MLRSGLPTDPQQHGILEVLLNAVVRFILLLGTATCIQNAGGDVGLSLEAFHISFALSGRLATKYYFIMSVL